jgi:hypothetical protein
MQKTLTIIILLLSGRVHVSGQDKNMQMPGMHDSMKMTSAFSRNLPMNRDGSGTAWQPDESPGLMYMKMNGNTTFMVHGSVFVRYNMQDVLKQSSRGGSKFDAPNMAAFMVTHKVGENDVLAFHAMISLDPFTIGAGGYPLLFQTGETYNGKPLVDRQHPHDLFSELAIAYTHGFSKDIDLTGYFGYPGEPALGPLVFMHRLSAMNNPDAPLGHHWQDATHISFGVATAGLRYKILKLEGSIFTGREPDENRYNFDMPRFDSYSYRISVNPDRNFALQFSQGFIHSPEALEPAVNIIRTTASVLHTMLLDHHKFIATSLVYGMNHSSLGQTLHSVLLESNLNLAILSIWSRYEFVQKDASELNLLQFNNQTIFNINAFTLGINKVLYSVANTDFSLGLQGTIDLADKQLAPVYGNSPLSFEVYLKIAPAGIEHKSSAPMPGMRK